MTADALLGEADSLYAMPLAEFTSARDNRAKELKKTDSTLAGQVKALRKPSVAAWVIGLLVRRQPEQVEQILQVGAALRQAQDQLDAEQLRALTRQRRQLTSAVTAQVRVLASDSGHRLTDAVADQVEQTLTAAMIDSDAGRALRSGMLIGALPTAGLDPAVIGKALAVPEALGFQATAQAPPAASRPDLHIVADPEPDETARRQAAAALAAANTRVEHATVAAEAAEERVEELSARSLELAAAIDELRRLISDRESELEQVDEDLAEGRQEVSAAHVELAAAVGAQVAAQRTLDNL